MKRVLVTGIIAVSQLVLAGLGQVRGDRTVVDHDDVVGVRRSVELVGDHHDRHAQLAD